MSMPNEPIFFNNVDLSLLEGVTIYNHDFTTMPVRKLTRGKLARADRSVLTSAEYTEKTVFVHGVVCGTDTATLEENFDNLKANIQSPEGIIRVTQSGLQIVYTGTLNEINKEYYGKKLKFTLGFLCSDPIGRDEVVTTLLEENQTTSTTTYSVQVEGNYKVRPNILIQVVAVTGGTDGNISVLNASNGQGIRVNHDYVNGDSLFIDADNSQVTLNNSLIDFDGTFPVFYPGNRGLQYIDDFSTRNVNLIVRYNKRFA